MSDTNLNIHLKAIDEFSPAFKQFQGTLNGVTSGIDKVGVSLRSTGREIGFVGSSFVLLGASITAPLLLAYNASAKYSAAITRQIYDMKQQYTDLQVSIGEALIPVMQQFNDILTALLDKWNALSPAQQQHIVQMTYLTGEYILFGGIALKVFGETLRSVGDLIVIFSKLMSTVSNVVSSVIRLALVNPDLLAMYAIITVIVAAMFQWKSVGDFVCDTMQKIGDVFAISGDIILGFINEIIGGIAVFLANVLGAIANIVKYIPGIGDKLKNSFQAGSDASKKFADDASKNMAGLTDNVKLEFADLTSSGSGHGALANYFDAMKLSIGGAVDGIHNFTNNFSNVVNMINGLASGAGGGGGKTKSNITGNFFAGFNQGLETAREGLLDFFTAGQNAAKNFTQSMQSTFSSFFDDAFTGQLKKGQDYFTSFGQSIIKIFDNVISQMITSWITSGIASLFSGIGGFKLGASPAGGGFSNTAPFKLPSFDVGTDYVPADMIAQIHKGEKIIPAGQNGNGGGDVQITIAPVIQLWDASDVQRNSRMLVDAVGQAIINNGTLRQIIKQNTR